MSNSVTIQAILTLMYEDNIHIDDSNVMANLSLLLLKHVPSTHRLKVVEHKKKRERSRSSERHERDKEKEKKKKRRDEGETQEQVDRELNILDYLLFILSKKPQLSSDSMFQLLITVYSIETKTRHLMQQRDEHLSHK